MERNLGAQIDRQRVMLSAKAASVLPDVCTFSMPSAEETRDAHGEVTTEPVTDPDLESVPCELAALNAFERQAGGETTATATNKLKLPATEKTLAIDGSYTGVIQARGNAPEKAFEVTGGLTSSADVWVILAVIIK